MNRSHKKKEAFEAGFCLRTYKNSGWTPHSGPYSSKERALWESCGLPEGTLFAVFEIGERRSTGRMISTNRYRLPPQSYRYGILRDLGL